MTASDHLNGQQFGDDYDDPQWGGREGLAASKYADQHHAPVGDWSRWASHGEEPDNCEKCGLHCCFVGSHWGHATSASLEEVKQHLAAIK